MKQNPACKDHLCGDRTRNTGLAARYEYIFRLRLRTTHCHWILFKARSHLVTGSRLGIPPITHSTQILQYRLHSTLPKTIICETKLVKLFGKEIERIISEVNVK